MKTDNYYTEKGVDTQIAVDILVATYEKSCNKILLVSSDTDLIPAVKKSIKLGMSIEYIRFSHKPTKALVSNCSNYKSLDKNDIEKFLGK